MAPSTPPNIQAKLKDSLKSTYGIFLIPEIMLPDMPPMSVRFGLADLANEGFIIRLARGIYYRPPVSEETHKRILPNPQEVARVVAKKSSMQIIPCMEHSAWLMGLPGGVYNPLSWLTNGASRKLKLYKGPTLEFKHTKEARLFTFKSDIMRDLSSGLRWIGKENISDEAERILKRKLAQVSREEILEDITKCPEWVRELIRG